MPLPAVATDGSLVVTIPTSGDNKGKLVMGNKLATYATGTSAWANPLTKDGSGGLQVPPGVVQFATTPPSGTFPSGTIGFATTTGAYWYYNGEWLKLLRAADGLSGYVNTSITLPNGWMSAPAGGGSPTFISNQWNYGSYSPLSTYVNNTARAQLGMFFMRTMCYAIIPSNTVLYSTLTFTMGASDSGPSQQAFLGVAASINAMNVANSWVYPLWLPASTSVNVQVRGAIFPSDANIKPYWCYYECIGIIV
jgi:hypothetical protein